MREQPERMAHLLAQHGVLPKPEAEREEQRQPGGAARKRRGAHAHGGEGEASPPKAARPSAGLASPQAAGRAAALAGGALASRQLELGAGGSGAGAGPAAAAADALPPLESLAQGIRLAVQEATYQALCRRHNPQLHEQMRGKPLTEPLHPQDVKAVGVAPRDLKTAGLAVLGVLRPPLTPP